MIDKFKILLLNDKFLLCRNFDSRLLKSKISNAAENEIVVIVQKQPIEQSQSYPYPSQSQSPNNGNNRAITRN